MKKLVKFWTAALCFLMLAACAAEPAPCTHGNIEDCGLCELEERIEALPTGGEMLAMDSDGRNRAYTQAQTLAEAYNALTAQEQGSITNARKLIDLHGEFSRLIMAAGD